VVVRIDHINGGNDSAWLFVNPDLAVEPSTNAASASSLGGFDFSFDRVRVFAGGSNTLAQPYAEMVVDEYRVGETYADVTPILPRLRLLPRGRSSSPTPCSWPATLSCRAPVARPTAPIA